MRLLFATTLLSVISSSFGLPDAHTDFIQTCSENGYASQSFTVITEDGYVSQIYRIPGKAGEGKTAKPVVLMMPGIECDMNFWTANLASIAPPFVLVE